MVMLDPISFPMCIVNTNTVFAKEPLPKAALYFANIHFEWIVFFIFF